ncbi:hypothetical protein ACFRCQ_08400 [Cytobacillus firmus]|uniref:hypothetical protein n=1 Tax=Cytobacillus firmus TaxID=1399 RepID=UPI0036A18A77
MPKKPNPVIQKAKEEGYNNGFKKGFELGQENACLVLAAKFGGLEKVPGIGPKLLEKVVNHFGSEYFEVIENEKP